MADVKFCCMIHTGVALLYFHMFNKLEGAAREQYLRQCTSYVDGALKRLRQRGVSFLCGDAGPLALGAVVYDRLNKVAASRDCLDK